MLAICCWIYIAYGSLFLANPITSDVNISKLYFIENTFFYSVFNQREDICIFDLNHNLYFDEAFESKIMW